MSGMPTETGRSGQIRLVVKILSQISIIKMRRNEVRIQFSDARRLRAGTRYIELRKVYVAGAPCLKGGGSVTDPGGSRLTHSDAPYQRYP